MVQVLASDDDDCLSPVSCCIGGSSGGHLALEEPKTKEYQYRDPNSETTDATIHHHHQQQAHVGTSGSLWSWMSSHAHSDLPKLLKAPTHLPILIIPGFMSSGLEIQQSTLRPEWQGKRLWINLGSLGMSSLYFGSAQQRQKRQPMSSSKMQEIQQEQQSRYKSMWLEHMRLQENDLRSDPTGIRVRPIRGLEGVDYLSPGTFTNHVSYVFGPVIRALKAAGYQEDVNLKAAPYDWRLPPVELEARDQYFSRTLEQVEELYHQNHNTPVVLLGHSLGSKTAHYFLNFCLQQRGQDWIDRHIHTYMPVGGPHLGAPKALRSVVAGDKMGLDAFLNEEEALALGRSFGSGPWLFPAELPQGVPASVHVLPHGVLEIRVDGPVNTTPLVDRRTALTKPNRYQLVVEMVVQGRPAEPEEKNRKVATSFHNITRDQDLVLFYTEKISFATHADPKVARSARLRFGLLEPGIAVAKQEKKESYCNPILCILKCIFCCCICDVIYRLLRCLTCGLLHGLALSADAVSGGVGGATTLAFSEYLAMPPELWTNGGKELSRTITIYHKDDYGARESLFCFSWWKKPRAATIPIRIRWFPFDTHPSARPSGIPVCQPNAGTPSGLKITKNNQTYQEFSGHDILEREGLVNTLQLIQTAYDGDATIGPRSKSSYDAPPVKRVHAIYGVNIPTEVGAIYKRKDRCLADAKVENLYKLDAKAQLQAKSGYITKGGLLFETPKTTQWVVEGGRKVCGDGTVPYWSLQHCLSWKGPGCEVSVVELDKAEHREILADSRFHKAIVNYCRIPKESV